MPWQSELMFYLLQLEMSQVPKRSKFSKLNPKLSIPPSSTEEEMHFFGDRALLGLDQERRRARTKTTILARARPRTKGEAFDDDPTRRRV